MSRYFCHDHPEILTLAARVVAARPGAVVLDRSPFHPGGGGQLVDRGTIAWSDGTARVVGAALEGGALWHLLDAPVTPDGAVEARVDAAFRARQSALHTVAHILNALVYREFDGALITGAQLKDDGTARVDFDLPGVSTDALRALEGAVNDVIRQDLPVRHLQVAEAAASAEPGLVRCRSVAPPPARDGAVRVVEIVGLDRQACGGTHLASTGGTPPIRILKIDNKGRHNRRIRFGLVETG
jgi:misacylated tRNA(Ala) deacylase